MKEKIVNACFCGIFFIIILTLGGVNLKNLTMQMNNNKGNLTVLESGYNEQFFGKTVLTDIYGLTQRLLNKQLIGNFEFFKDDAGIMHPMASSTYSGEQGEAFAEDVIKLNSILEEKGIPMAYIQIPSREQEGYSAYPSGIFDETREVIDAVLNELKSAGVICLDMGEACRIGEAGFEKEEFFFSTDLHLTTDAELWVGSRMVDFLRETAGCEIDSFVMDKHNYRKETYSFVGNLSRSSGKFYTRKDEFDIYYPDFETSFSLDNRIQGTERSGSFEQVVMNGLAESDYNDYTYWVVNYLQFTSPYYTIHNNLQSRNRILFIMDSMCFRAVSYLTLGCEEITILDPRFFGGVDYINMVIEENEYDAVILCHESSLLPYSLFPEEKNRQELSELEIMDEAQNGSLDYCNDVWTENRAEIQVNLSEAFTELRGWSADVGAGLPGQALYLQIGSHLIRCDYGLDSGSVAAFFCNENLGNVGFSVRIPNILFKNMEDPTFIILVVSADGEKIIPSIQYTVKVE